MEKLDVEFELFRKRVYNLEIRSFYLLLLNRGCDIKTLRALFSDVDEKLALKMDGMFYRAQSDRVQEVLEKVIKQEVAKDEVSVIITNNPCVLLIKNKKPLYAEEPDKCKKCGMCMKPGCPAMTRNADKTIHIDDTMCTGCGLCKSLCKFDAIKLVREGDK